MKNIDLKLKNKRGTWDEEVITRAEGHIHGNPAGSHHQRHCQ